VFSFYYCKFFLFFTCFDLYYSLSLLYTTFMCQVSRTARQEAGSEYRCHIFDKCGKIFVAAGTLPSHDDLIQLLTCSGGTV
jgi:hypothetical protein